MLKNDKEKVKKSLQRLRGAKVNLLVRFDPILISLHFTYT